MEDSGMSSRDRVQGIAATAIALAGISWLGQAAFADERPRDPVLVAEVVAADGKDAAAEPAAVSTKAPEANRSSASLPIFVPRTSRGAPASRIGGASRGVDPGLVVRALVPEFDDAALTLSEQPSLPWHLSKGTEHAVNFTLVDPQAVEPLLDVTIPGPFQAGFHRIELAAHGARLEAGKRYQWFVAVVPDPNRRSADVVARGSVERVVEPAPLAAQIAGASPEKRAAVLAKAGIWYDALEAIDRQMPDRRAVAQRDALLAQVGIEIDPTN